MEALLEAVHAHHHFQKLLPHSGLRVGVVWRPQAGRGAVGRWGYRGWGELRAGSRGADLAPLPGCEGPLAGLWA